VFTLAFGHLKCSGKNEQSPWQEKSGNGATSRDTHKRSVTAPGRKVSYSEKGRRREDKGGDVGLGFGSGPGKAAGFPGGKGSTSEPRCGGTRGGKKLSSSTLMNQGPRFTDQESKKKCFRYVIGNPRRDQDLTAVLQSLTKKKKKKQKKKNKKNKKEKEEKKKKKKDLSSPHFFGKWGGYY